MTRYSASRGILYAAPPGPDGRRTEADTEQTDAGEREADADGVAVDAEAEDAAADD